MHIAAVATTAMRSDKNWNEVRKKTNLTDTCKSSKPISQWSLVKLLQNVECKDTFYSLSLDLFWDKFDFINIRKYFTHASKKKGEDKWKKNKQIWAKKIVWSIDMW